MGPARHRARGAVPSAQVLSEDRADREASGRAGGSHGGVVAVQFGRIDDVVHSPTQVNDAVAPAPGGGAAIKLRKSVGEIFFTQPIHNFTVFIVVEIAGDYGWNIRTQGSEEALQFLAAVVTSPQITAHAETATVGDRRAKMDVEDLDGAGRGVKEANPSIEPAGVGR